MMNDDDSVVGRKYRNWLLRGRCSSLIVAGAKKTNLECIEARLRSIDRLDRRKAAKLEKLRKQRKE